MEDEGRPDLRKLVNIHEYTEGQVMAAGDVKVTALRNLHPPITESYALKFEFPGRTIVFSGDTAYYPPLAAFAKGADILVHEVMYAPALEELVRRNPNAATLMAHLKASHTLTDDVGRIAAEAGVKKLVINHFVPADATGAGEARRTRPLPSAERSDLSGAPDAAPPSHASQALPEPDPAEVRSSAGAAAADYAVGDILDGRLQIMDVIGQGGFSKVYRVRDDVEGEERALKLFETAAGYEAVRREIGALRKIHHPNVVEVFWAGKTSAGDWYLITELIDGESLDEFVTGNRHLRDREAVDVALDLLDALVAFHPDSARLRELDAKREEGDLAEAESREWTELKDKGLVHRDIKPLNVMLTRTGAKLLDFNIASRVGDPVHTRSGTPPYQPPDADRDRWDVSTDLFAVGVLLYRLLCDGHHPFPQARPMIDVPVTDPRTIRSDLNPDLAGFLITACAPARADRFSTAADMQLALRNVRADL
jgi:hypothetical protein